MGEIYAIDFDGTLCENRYPNIGDPIKEVIDYVKGLKENGNELILWTCRVNDKLEDAITWCEDQGIIFDAINENLQSVIDEYGTDPRKITAYKYIDDRAITIESIISGEEVIQKVKKGMEQSKIWELKQSISDPNVIDMYIYGDVQGDYFDWWDYETIESETSSNHFRNELNKYPDAKQINIFINSYGGSVFEGTAIYSQLKRHTAQKIVYIDGFACSVASIIAMAGDKIIMPKNTMMMIHNAWSCSCGNSKELRKAAEDLDVIMEGNRQAYLEKSNGKITEEKLVELLENETWLTAEQCIEYGFADEIMSKEADMKQAQQLLQKANKTIEQKISYNRAISSQLKEVIQKPKELIVNAKPETQEPTQKTNAEKLRLAFSKKMEE